MCQCLQALVPTSLGKKSRRAGPECCKADLNTTCPVDQDEDHDADDDEDEKKLDEDEDEGEECRLPASAPLSCL